MNKSKVIRYIGKNLDEAGILAALGNIKVAEKLDSLKEQDQLILEAFKRYSNSTQSLDEIQNYLEGMAESQIPGVVNNVKGILHELEFVSMENEDGDEIKAFVFQDPNHPRTDVTLYDSTTNEPIKELQLKATDDYSLIEKHYEKYPDGDEEMVVTAELAEKTGLKSSGISHEQITLKVEDFIDSVIKDESKYELISALPALSALSISVVIYKLYKRYKREEISKEKFQRLCVLFSGGKVIKIGLIITALGIPGLNIVVGTALVAKLLLSGIALKNQNLS